MEIIVGKFAGFCFGVTNAVTKANNLLKNQENIYALGDLVHNDYVIEKLKEKGMILVNDIKDVPENSKMIIRAHGEEKSVIEKAKAKNITMYDLTCPKLIEVCKKIIDDNSFYIIIGKKGHPEVKYYSSYITNFYIIENIEDINEAYETYLKSEKGNIVSIAQTTFNQKKYLELTHQIKEVFKNYSIQFNNTICDATMVRQNEVKKIAKIVNKMIIIGDKKSSNSTELYNIAREICKDTIMIQNKEGLNNIYFNRDDVIGISAGASVPSDIILEVKRYLIEKYE